MTNQPDESHPLRDRVDDAISWFTQTNEPDEQVASAADESVAPAQDETAALPHDETAPAVEEPAMTAAPALDGTPLASTLPGNEAAPVDLPPAGVAEPTEPTEAVAPTEPVEAAPAAPAAPADDAVVEAVHAPDAAPENVPATAPSYDASAVAPERVYEADEFSSHPVEPAVPQSAYPTDVAPERVTEADGFMPARAVVDEPATDVDSEPVRAAQEAVVDEPVAAEPVAAEPVESSQIDEPTRIHPIDPPSSWAEVHPEARQLPDDAAETEAAASQRSLFRDEAPTVALPVGAAAPVVAPAVEQTAVLDAQEAARVRREERAARDRQLGKVIAASDDADEPLVTKFTTPTTYKGLPSLGFLVFRLVIAAVIGIRAWQHLTHLSATRDMWAATVVPSPGIISWTQIGLEIAIAVMLVIGLGTRIAGLALLVLSGALLAFVQWGAVSPFQPGATDFIGVVDVLLAGAGILLATVGGGRIAFDGAIHIGHIRRKNDKLFA